ncbi:MAG: hypothetical protein WCP70_02685 [Methanothrix sp.]
MNNIKKGSCSESLNGKLAYDPPKAMRLNDMRSGAGGPGCFNTGSSNSSSCSTGSSASGLGCISSGNSPR